MPSVPTTDEQCAFADRLLSEAGRLPHTGASSDQVAEQLSLLLGSHSEHLDSHFPSALGAVWDELARRFPKPGTHLQLAYAAAQLGEALRRHGRRGYVAAQEGALVAFKKALSVFTAGNFSLQRAAAQRSLGSALQERLGGNPAQKIEEAIAAYLKALTIFTRADHPVECATTERSLGAALTERQVGSRSRNIEAALAALRRARRAYAEHRRPFDEARAQIRIGNALTERVEGARAQNIENAIDAFTEALSVCSVEQAPVAWAAAKNGIGGALVHRVRGDRAENIEGAISALRDALKVRTKEAYPHVWAVTQSNLGVVLANRVEGDPAQHVEAAIHAFRQALTVLRKDSAPLSWAITQRNLGSVLHERSTGNPAKNTALAIAAFKKALGVLTYEKTPFQWAMTQHNFGLALLDLGEDGSAASGQNAERAVAAFKEALSVYTRESLPFDWAKAQGNLGVALAKRGENGSAARRIEGLVQASNAFRAAFEVLTPPAFPHESLKFGLNLGRAGLETSSWDDAVFGYRQAVEAAEQHRRQTSDERRRGEILDDAEKAYAGLVKAYLRAGQPAEALETAERIKARGLADLLAEQELQSDDVPGALLGELKTLRQKCVSLERQLRASKEKGRVRALKRSLEAAERKTEDLLEKIGGYDPAFPLAQPEATPLTAAEIAALLPDQKTALVSWMLTAGALYAFVVTPGESAAVPATVELRQEDMDLLVATANPYFRLYREEKHGEWSASLEKRLDRLSQALRIGDLLTAIPEACDRLIAVPHGALHLLPLCALPLPGALGLSETPESSEATEQCLLDRFPRGISQVPSAQLLRLAFGRERPHFDALFAVENPTEDLDYAGLEVQAVAQHFPHATVLAGQAASKAAVTEPGQLSSAHCLHFACHGAFNPDRPLESALLLAGGKPSGLNEQLTLGEVFGLNLEQCRLAVLSACETGQVDLKRSGQEYVGLPGGFLFAGASAVVGSLWPVNDFSTALLMARFYELLAGHPRSHRGNEVGAPREEARSGRQGAALGIAEALGEAQRWLRGATASHLRELARSDVAPGEEGTLASRSADSEAAFRRANRIWKEAERQLADSKADERPFEAPYYWAAFVAIGS